MKHFVTLSLIVGALLTDVRAHIHLSTSLSGDACTGDNSRLCPEECDNGHCTCVNRSMTGVPSIGCMPGDYIVCSVRGDPKVHTFRNQILEYPIPCQYLLTGGDFFVFDQAEGGRTGDVYKFQIFAYNRRIRGKAFPAGFRVDIERNVGNSTTSLAFRVDGRVLFGTYSYFTFASTDGGTTWFNYLGKDNNPILNVDSYSLDFDSTYNRIFFTYPEMGLAIAFRAADDFYQGLDQNYLAGVVVGFKSEADISYDPRGFCFTPSIDSWDMISEDLTEEAGLLMLASTNTNVPQDFKDASNACTDLAEPITSCGNTENRDHSTNACTELFQYENFVHCFSETFPDDKEGNGNSMLTLFKTCIRAVCHHSSLDCHDMTHGINFNCTDEAPGGLSGYDCDFIEG